MSRSTQISAIALLAKEKQIARNSFFKLRRQTRICCFRNISGDVARKAKEKNKFLPSFQSFRPFNLATYAVCRTKHTAAIGYPLMTRYRWNNPHQKDMMWCQRGLGSLHLMQPSWIHFVPQLECQTMLPLTWSFIMIHLPSEGTRKHK